jgi:hypothetical protein
MELVYNFRKMAANIQVRDWRVSKFPLRIIARVIFLTYMWAGAVQVLITPECKTHICTIRFNSICRSTK